MPAKKTTAKKTTAAVSAPAATQSPFTRKDLAQRSLRNKRDAALRGVREWHEKALADLDKGYDPTYQMRWASGAFEDAARYAAFSRAVVGLETRPTAKVVEILNRELVVASRGISGGEARYLAEVAGVKALGDVLDALRWA